MSEKDKKPSIFQKMLDASTAILDAQIAKARSQVINQNTSDFDLVFSKAIDEDPTYNTSTMGYKERRSRLQDGHCKQIAQANSVIASIIQTRQNQVSNFSKIVTSNYEKGIKLILIDEEERLADIKEKLKKEQETTPEVKPKTEFELNREAKKLLEQEFKQEKLKLKNFLINCGETEHRPFKSKKWNLDSALRAMVRDSLTYDKYAVVKVPDMAQRLHHWYPIDASTIKYAGRQLKKYKQNESLFQAVDILYPELEGRKEKAEKILELNDDLLEKEAYKYVQVVGGKIERAYTEDELALGIRNLTTDIYNNGYGISEIELALSLITGHLNAEFYNQAYFTQGFSAKGILHIKSPLNRRKMDTVRQQWNHLLKGSRNSFQTPIIAGSEEVKWIPLTQSHGDIGFEGWMRYLIKMICSIYQIDPHEIGVGFREEGGSGGQSADNTKDKIGLSKDKGLYPLLKHLAGFLNEHIVSMVSKNFKIEFVGIRSETPEEALKREDAERKYKKTVNEIREESGLPPLPGMDDYIPGTEYAQWYAKFSDKAIEQQKEMMGGMGVPGQTSSQEEQTTEDELQFDDLLAVEDEAKEEVQKSLVKVEYFTLED